MKKINRISDNIGKSVVIRSCYYDKENDTCKWDISEGELEEYDEARYVFTGRRGIPLINASGSIYTISLMDGEIIYLNPRALNMSIRTYSDLMEEKRLMFGEEQTKESIGREIRENIYKGNVYTKRLKSYLSEEK